MADQLIGGRVGSGAQVRQNGLDSSSPPAKPVWQRLAPLGLLVLGAAAFFALGGHRYLTWEALRDNRQMLQDWVAQNGLLAGLAFFAVYATATAFSLPFGAVLSLAGGFLFGTVLSSMLVVTAATLGAVAVFLAARTALGDVLRSRAKGFLGRMEKGFGENAFSYLLFLRLVPVFPFWLVNIVPAILGMRLGPYALATLIGIIPGSVVFAAVGNGLGALFENGERPDFNIIFKPEILLPMLALAALSLVPVLYQRWKGSPK